jgi:hypothetical protein
MRMPIHCAPSPYVLAGVALLLKFSMNTIRTAQYAAVAAKSLTRFAFVGRLIGSENNREETIKSPLLRNILERP